MGTIKHNKRIRINEIFSKKDIPTVSKNVKRENIKKYNLYRIAKLGIYSNYSLFTQDIENDDLFISLGTPDSYGCILGIIVKHNKNPYKIDFLARKASFVAGQNSFL